MRRLLFQVREHFFFIVFLIHPTFLRIHRASAIIIFTFDVYVFLLFIISRHILFVRLFLAFACNKSDEARGCLCMRCIIKDVCAYKAEI